jgi:hypothetical protein
MILFALLFALFFLIFWVSFPQNELPGLFSISLALLTGAFWALVRYLVVAEPRFHDFGQSLYGTALTASLLPPVVLPAVVYVLLRRLRVLADEAGGWAAWLLLAMIPYCAVFALAPAEPGTVKQLVLLPLLWMVQIIGIHFFIRGISGMAHLLLRVLFVAGALAVPFLCAAVYWAWAAKEPVWFVLLLLPLEAVFAGYFIRAKKI